MIVKCPKCGSNADWESTKHPFMWGRTEIEIQCRWCGTRRYGDDARRIVDSAIDEARRREEAEQRRLREEAEARRLREEAESAARVDPPPVDPKPRPPARRPANSHAAGRDVLAARRVAAVAALGGDASTLCEYPLCTRPHRMNARYCSKQCSDHVARARYRARRQGPTSDGVG